MNFRLNPVNSIAAKKIVSNLVTAFLSRCKPFGKYLGPEVADPRTPFFVRVANVVTPQDFNVTYTLQSSLDDEPDISSFFRRQSAIVARLVELGERIPSFASDYMMDTLRVEAYLRGLSDDLTGVELHNIQRCDEAAIASELDEFFMLVDDRTKPGDIPHLFRQLSAAIDNFYVNNERAEKLLESVGTRELYTRLDDSRIVRWDRKFCVDKRPYLVPVDPRTGKFDSPRDTDIDQMVPLSVLVSLSLLGRYSLENPEFYSYVRSFQDEKWAPSPKLVQANTWIRQLCTNMEDGQLWRYNLGAATLPAAILTQSMIDAGIWDFSRVEQLEQYACNEPVAAAREYMATCTGIPEWESAFDMDDGVASDED